MKEQYYKSAEQNVAFDRCIDVMTRLIQKYGPAILEEVRKRRMLCKDGNETGDS